MSALTAGLALVAFTGLSVIVVVLALDFRSRDGLERSADPDDVARREEEWPR